MTEVSMGGSGGGFSGATNITKSALLSLISTDGVLNILYNITDISGFDSLIVSGVAPNEIKPSGDGILLIPDYTIAGNNLGQMEWDNIPAIQPDEFVVWGGFYWKNETLSPVTPTITDDTTLAGGLTKLSKSVANGYIKYAVDVTLNKDLDVIIVSDGNGNSVRMSRITNILETFDYEAHQWNYSDTWRNNECFIVNCFGQGSIISNKNDSDAGYIKRCSLASGTFIFQNNFTAFASGQEAYISQVKLNSGSIGSFIYGNELHLSYFENIELTDCSIDQNYLTNLSFFKNMTLDGNGSFGFVASTVANRESGFDGFSMTGGFDINNQYINNKTVINNATDIQIQNLQTDKSLDLAGFSANILYETISAGKGFFTVNYDFGANPILSGNAVFYNLIPDNAVCDRATLIVNSALSGTGSLEIGIQTDDEDYVIPATAAASVVNGVVNTLSNAATGNRSLRLAVSGGDITGGVITIKIEFIV